ncbi:MAG TPA: ferredoxin family protein [Cellulomonas sp.]
MSTAAPRPGPAPVGALLGLDRFEVDEAGPHIVIDPDICAVCVAQPCLPACPAQLYALDADGRMTFDHAGCLECGTCRIVCAAGGIVRWTYPRAGYGVEYRQG